jgi:hypothetical protein
VDWSARPDDTVGAALVDPGQDPHESFLPRPSKPSPPKDVALAVDRHPEHRSGASPCVLLGIVLEVFLDGLRSLRSVLVGWVLWLRCNLQAISRRLHLGSVSRCVRCLTLSFNHRREQRRILDVAKGDRLSIMVVLAQATGLRQSELLGVRWSDLDLNARVLRFRVQYGRDKVLRPPKTDAGERLPCRHSPWRRYACIGPGSRLSVRPPTSGTTAG